MHQPLEPSPLDSLSIFRSRLLCSSFVHRYFSFLTPLAQLFVHELPSVTYLTQYALVVLGVTTMWLEWVCAGALAATDMKIMDSWVARAGRPGLDSRHGKIFLFSAAFGQALRSNQPPIQWAVSPGINRPGREADHSPPSSVEVRNGGAIPSLLHISSRHSA
jgi:hypothetical protein